MANLAGPESRYPPRPEALIDAVMKIQKKIDNEGPPIA